jgi:hypothetical protein
LKAQRDAIGETAKSVNFDVLLALTVGNTKMPGGKPLDPETARAWSGFYAQYLDWSKKVDTKTTIFGLAPNLAEIASLASDGDAIQSGLRNWQEKLQSMGLKLSTPVITDPSKEGLFGTTTESAKKYGPYIVGGIVFVVLLVAAKKVF